MNSNSVSRNPFILLDKKKMTESLAALKARYNARPKCQEHSWDIRSFTRLQMQAFLDILHRDCDETECEADNSSNDWRSHPEAYRLKYEPGWLWARLSSTETPHYVTVEFYHGRSD